MSVAERPYLTRSMMWLFALSLAAFSANQTVDGLSHHSTVPPGRIETSTPEDVNLGDCLRHSATVKAWPAAWRHLCAEIDFSRTTLAAPAATHVKPHTRIATVAPAVAVPDTVPMPIAPPLRKLARVEIAQTPAPSCVVAEDGSMLIENRRKPRNFATRLVAASPSRVPGIAIGVPASCAVRSPVAGTVAFAGEFQGYRNLVIVELPHRTRLVIAGLGTLRVARGDTVHRGDVLGSTAKNRAPALAALFGGDADSLLLFELRGREKSLAAVPWIGSTS